MCFSASPRARSSKIPVDVSIWSKRKLHNLIYSCSYDKFEKQSSALSSTAAALCMALSWSHQDTAVMWNSFLKYLVSCWPLTKSASPHIQMNVLLHTLTFSGKWTTSAEVICLLLCCPEACGIHLGCLMGWGWSKERSKKFCSTDSEKIQIKKVLGGHKASIKDLVWCVCHSG